MLGLGHDTRGATPVGGEHDERLRRRDDGLVEAKQYLVGRPLDPALLAGRGPLQCRVGHCHCRHDERAERRGDHHAPHGTPPARSERWPKIGATSRSANSITASAIHVAAKP